MPRRKPLPPDTRLSWRDPNMPLIRKGREIDHKKMEIYAKLAIERSPEPNWRNDPTYNMRKK